MNLLNVQELEIGGLYEVTRKVRVDNRGDFTRIYGLGDLSSVVWPWSIGQVNLSRTNKSGTIRGIHVQVAPYTEAKLVSCIRGRLWDVAVDLRPESETFLHYISLELTAVEANALLIPPGFGHGFQTLEDETEVLYIHSSRYNFEADSGISPFDKKLKIAWPLDVVEISPRDLRLPTVDSFFRGLNLRNQ